MTLLKTWDTIRTTLVEFGLPPALEKAVRWAQRHPHALVASALVVVVAVALTQTPPERHLEPDAYNGEAPLFV